MTAGIFLGVLVQWGLLACTGKYLAARWQNPQAWILPLLLGGVLGTAVLAAASLPVAVRQREYEVYLRERGEAAVSGVR